jgi:copper chaperone CopZ
MKFRLMFLMTTTLVTMSGFAAADDKPGKTERNTYRVLGMFSPDREKDLREVFKELPDITLIAVNFEDAEITVEFIPSKLFPDAKPEQITERFDQKLRSMTRSTFGVKPRRTTPRDKLTEVIIPVEGLDCKACCLAAYEAIAGIDGVEQATASFKEGKVTALIDPKKTDRAKLEDGLCKRGVTVAKP